MSQEICLDRQEIHHQVVEEKRKSGAQGIGVILGGAAGLGLASLSRDGFGGGLLASTALSLGWSVGRGIDERRAFERVGEARGLQKGVVEEIYASQEGLLWLKRQDELAERCRSGLRMLEGRIGETVDSLRNR